MTFLSEFAYRTAGLYALLLSPALYFAGLIVLPVVSDVSAFVARESAKDLATNAAQWGWRALRG